MSLDELRSKVAMSVVLVRKATNGRVYITKKIEVWIWKSILEILNWWVLNESVVEDLNLKVREKNYGKTR